MSEEEEEGSHRSLHGFVPVTPEAEALRCAKAASRCFSLRCDRHKVLTWEWMGASCYLRLGAALKRPTRPCWGLTFKPDQPLTAPLPSHTVSQGQGCNSTSKGMQGEMQPEKALFSFHLLLDPPPSVFLHLLLSY
ncbi:unnamed protein product [Pleuronectes platessa]|uniref:Uncharacterized protein n=1 Tax=Pleuronectes platessa TaxID=8262 RepID=A0A9N7TMY1_PLEPL|nr:unnamed protein product [Pleuronectes platessa]